MNEITKMTSQLQVCDRKETAKQVMSVCRAITPQFYRNMGIEDMKAEKMSIELLTADIDGETLAEMCRRAVLNYPKARSENNRTFFDINYILQFYKQSFNFVHCENIKISKEAIKVYQEYDCVRGILFQKWREPNGEEKTVAIIQEEKKVYSPKDYERMFADINDII